MFFDDYHWKNWKGRFDMEKFEFHPRFEFFDGEPEHDYWDKEMHGILIHAMDGLTKKKQQEVYKHVVALMHMAYRHGYARGCHAGAGDVLNYKADENALPLDFGMLYDARQNMKPMIVDANHKDKCIMDILDSIAQAEQNN